MSVNKNVEFKLAYLSIHNYFTFIIKNINPDFASSFYSSINTNKANSFLFLKKNEVQTVSELENDEKEKLFTNEIISNHDLISSYLESFLLEINSSFNAKKPLFLPFESKKILEEKFETPDLRILGDNWSETRYIYQCNIHPENSIFLLAEKLEIYFVINPKKNQIDCGIVFDLWDEEDQVYGKKEILKKLYLNSLVQAFLKKEFNRTNLIDLVADLDFLKTHQIKENDKVKKLYSTWSKLVKNKVDIEDLASKETFYSCLNLVLISSILMENMRLYFQSKNPKKYLATFFSNQFFKNHKVDNQAELFFLLITYIKTTYLKNLSDASIRYQSSKDINDQLTELGSSLIKIERISTVYELTRNANIPFLDEDEDIFLKSSFLKILFLFFYKSELFGIDLGLNNFLNFENFYAVFNQYENDKTADDLVEELIDTYVCEWNYHYIGFVDNEFTTVLIKNEYLSKNKQTLEVMDNFEVNTFDNYMYSLIYYRNVLIHLFDFDQQIQLTKTKNPWKLRKLLYELDMFKINWNDNFYGINQVKNIVKKIDAFFNLNEINARIWKRLSLDDKAYGKTQERKNLTATFASAVVFGMLDFLTMIYSVLTVPADGIGLSPVNITIISIGALLVSTLVVLLISLGIKSAFVKKRMKNG